MSALLEIQNLNVSYGAIRALKNVKIEVKEQSITAILGANGGGKSTLLKKISGIVDAQSGEIIFDGEDITKMSPEKIANKGIIHVPEGRQIFGDLTVLENLMIGAFTAKGGDVPMKNVFPGIIKQKKQEELDRINKDDQNSIVHLTKKEMIKNNLLRVYDYFPVLKERKNQVALSLSGGEQQMLAIGRGLMSTPKLLILDEPSLGLAPLIVKDIFQIIKQLKEEGLSILIVEQNALQTLKIADYGYVLQVGDIVKEGLSKTLINDPELIEAYLGK
ncbi:MAG: ABC transporter ATP-binding protein [Candidatus Izemoplasmataceae bacterium]